MIRLNPALEADALAQDYAKRRRMQIRDFLVEEDAEAIYQHLLERTPWWVAYNVGEQVEQIPPQRIASMSREQIAGILAGIQERARVQYQFLYEFYPLFSHYFTRSVPWLPIFGVYEFINSPAMIGFFRKLTGRADIQWADGHATMFRSGHFLKYHTDENAKDQRVAAYVLNLTKGWGRDWGGYLQFFNDRYDVEEAYRPVFNALNIFTVPMDHSVNMVTTYAPGRRLSVTGWLRADAPPGAFDRNGR